MPLGWVEFISLGYGMYRLQLPEIPSRIGQFGEHAAQAFTPLRVYHAEIGIIFQNASLHAGVQTSVSIYQQIDRHANGDIAAHGRIEGHE